MLFKGFMVFVHIIYILVDSVVDKYSILGIILQISHSHNQNNINKTISQQYIHKKKQ
jgi:hypothetical protein